MEIFVGLFLLLIIEHKKINMYNHTESDDFVRFRTHTQSINH